MAIVNYDSSVVNKFGASLTNNARVVIYDRHMSIVQATDVHHKTFFLCHRRCGKISWNVCHRLVYQARLIFAGKGMSLTITWAIVRSFTQLGPSCKYSQILNKLE